MLKEIILASSLLFNSIATPLSTDPIIEYLGPTEVEVGTKVYINWKYKHGDSTRKVFLDIKMVNTGSGSSSANVNDPVNGWFSDINTNRYCVISEGMNEFILRGECYGGYCSEGSPHTVTKTVYVKGVPPDTTLPIIHSVSKSPTDWTNTPVLVDIYATDNKALHYTPYSFDNGLTWQLSSKREFTDNKVLDVNVQDAKGNKTHRSITIGNIDKLKPNNPICEVR